MLGERRCRDQGNLNEDMCPKSILSGVNQLETDIYLKMRDYELTFPIMKQIPVNGVISSSLLRCFLGGGGCGAVVATCIPSATNMRKRIDIRNCMFQRT